jgi:hypothetical protein
MSKKAILTCNLQIAVRQLTAEVNDNPTLVCLIALYGSSLCGPNKKGTKDVHIMCAQRSGF